MYLQLFDGNVQVLTGLLQVLDADVVHREESCSGSVLGTHVGDGGSVSDGQLGHAGAEELHKLPYNSHLPQVLQEEQQTPVTNYTQRQHTHTLTRAVWASTLVTVRTMSVEVISLSAMPDSLYPTTSGRTMLIGWPSITASASIPPTPARTHTLLYIITYYYTLIHIIKLYYTF